MAAAGAIAVVDAFDAPNVAADLGSYSSEFGLPAVTSSNFEKVYACAWSGLLPPPTCSGSQPEYDSGWELEESLDTQIAHAMAPATKVFLVEAQSSSLVDLAAAELKAAYLVAQAGGGEVSNSWGAPEFLGETTGDAFFSTPGVVYFASTGDSPGTNYPSVSPNVVAVGGTSLSRNPLTGAFIGEATWSLAGGGPSTYEARPPYQNSASRIVGASRGVPDVAAVANPVTGVWTYVSAQGGWLIVGGTSVGSPLVAAVVNNVGRFSLSTAVELSMTYNDPDYSHFSDIKDGTCGPHEGYFAATGGTSSATLELIEFSGTGRIRSTCLSACNTFPTRCRGVHPIRTYDDTIDGGYPRIVAGAFAPCRPAVASSGSTAAAPDNFRPFG